MRILWGRRNSGNVMKVTWLLHELGAAHERRDTGAAVRKEVAPKLLALNPNGLVPILQEDDFVLWESNAILRYLALTVEGGAAFYPPDLRQRANIDRWMDWQQTVLANGFGKLFYMVAKTPPARQKTERIPLMVEGAARQWQLLDAILAAHAYVGGANLSLADFAIGPQVHRWFSLPVKRPGLPHLQAWYDRLLERPEFVEHGAVPVVPPRG